MARARGQQPPEMVKEAYPHGVVIRVARTAQFLITGRTPSLFERRRNAPVTARFSDRQAHRGAPGGGQQNL